MTLKSGAPRTDTDIRNGRVKLRRSERGVGYAKNKAMDRLCDKANLRFKFAVPDYSEVLKPDGDAGLAALKVDAKDTFSSFRTWCEESDTTTIFMIPERISSFSDLHQVASAASHTNLLINHQGVDLDTVTGFQQFINTAADDVEIDSNNMVLRVLQRSNSNVRGENGSIV